MSRKRIRLIVMIVLLVVLLALLLAAYLNFRETRKVGLDIPVNNDAALSTPQYLYSFSGEGADRLARPLGVAVYDGRVYVTDARRRVLDVFTVDGQKIATWGQGKLAVPLYVARNPKTGEFWVTDRRTRSIHVFSAAGKYLREFDPKLPEAQLPKFETDGVQWAPVALAFASDGTLYVTEILNGHRMLIFSPDGTFKKSVGNAGLVTDATEGPEAFQFPNSVKISGKEVWVSDSNNRRIQVFDLDGKFKRIVATQGLPRGFDFLPKLDQKEPRWIVVIDTLSHDGTIWNADSGAKMLTFGERGVLEAQFSYPNDTAVDAKRKIFVADSYNGRIQVWGWPAQANPVPTPDTPLGWALCLSPLLLLPLLLLLRRRRYFATRDFVVALHELDQIDRMPHARVRWEVTPEDYEVLSALEPQHDVDLSQLLHAVEHSESDAKALQERYELEWEQAVVLSIAQRAKLFGTEDPELRRVSRVLEIPVVDHLEYIERSNRKKGAESGRP